MGFGEQDSRRVWEEKQFKENMNSYKSSRENWKGLKTAPVSAKHAIFATGLSRHIVASSSRQNTQDQNFEKFF